MKVLVIGGNRFFGKKLVQRLLNKGSSVTLLNRGSYKDGFGSEVQRIVLDRQLLSKDHPQLNQQWDLIYDQVCFDALEAEQACEVFRYKTKHYIFTSSQSVYNPGKDIRESAFNPDTYSIKERAQRDENYAEAKRQAESVFAQAKAFPVTMVRFPIVVGSDDYTGRLKFHVDHIADGKPMYFPNVNAKMSFVHSDDAARALEFVGEKKILGPINVCAKDPVVLHDLVKVIESVVGRQAKLVHKETDGEHSPYGIEADWYMNVNKLEAAGFTANAVREWLPVVVKELQNK